MIQQPYFQNLSHRSPKQTTFPFKNQPIFVSTEKLQHINQILESETDVGGVFIGDTISILKPQLLQQHNIKAILCCNQEAASNMNLVPSTIVFKIMEMQDHPEYPIQVHFESAIKFIDENRKKGSNVLIQCHGGVSRSATLLCAYLIKKKQINAQEALSIITQKRSRVKPNQGFWEKLVAFGQAEEKCKPTQSIYCSPRTTKKEFFDDSHYSSQKTIKRFVPLSPKQSPKNYMQRSLPYNSVTHLPSRFTS